MTRSAHLRSVLQMLPTDECVDWPAGRTRPATASPPAAPACPASGAFSVKAAERGYDPDDCDASGLGYHGPPLSILDDVLPATSISLYGQMIDAGRG